MFVQAPHCNNEREKDKRGSSEASEAGNCIPPWEVREWQAQDDGSKEGREVDIFMNYFRGSANMSYCWIGLWMGRRLLLSIGVERLNELWIVALCTKMGKGIIIHYALHLVWDKWTEISSSHKDLELWGGIHWCAELRNRDLQILVKVIGVNKFTWRECKEEWIWSFPGFQVLLRIWWKLRIFFFFKAHSCKYFYVGFLRLL